MTPEQVATVQASFAKVAPIAPAAAELFYGRLFEIAPAARGLFKNDMKEQGRKLMATLAYVVGGVARPDEVIAAAQKLAVRHVEWGVKSEHYALVGEALLWTLGKGLGEAFTPEVEADWKVAYATLSGAMIAAAYPQNA